MIEAKSANECCVLQPDTFWLHALSNEHLYRCAGFQIHSDSLFRDVLLFLASSPLVTSYKPDVSTSLQCEDEAVRLQWTKNSISFEQLLLYFI